MTQMRSPWLTFVLSFSFVAVGSCPVSGQPSPPSIYQRPTVVNARIGGGPRLRDGSYNATGVSGVCGLIPKEASLTGEAMFVVDFPSDAPNGSITSIAFGSNQLVSGNATATAFRLSVGVVTSAGGRPPLYVLNTDAPRSRSSGTAKLATRGGETTLTVKGQDDMDESIELTVVCS